MGCVNTKKKPESQEQPKDPTINNNQQIYIPGSNYPLNNNQNENSIKKPLSPVKPFDRNQKPIQGDKDTVRDQGEIDFSLNVKNFDIHVVVSD